MFIYFLFILFFIQHTGQDKCSPYAQPFTKVYDGLRRLIQLCQLAGSLGQNKFLPLRCVGIAADVSRSLALDRICPYVLGSLMTAGQSGD